jgi:hypothetical protein
MISNTPLPTFKLINSKLLNIYQVLFQLCVWGIIQTTTNNSIRIRRPIISTKVEPTATSPIISSTARIQNPLTGVLEPTIITQI